MTQQSSMKPKYGDNLRLEVTALAFGGEGVARHEGLVVFVAEGLPGDVVEATVGKVKKNHAFARITRVITPSPDRMEPRCPHFGACGGCKLQHCRYEKQLELKESQVRETLEHIGGMASPPVLPIRAAQPWNYRNKMEFTFGPGEDDAPAMGMHRAGRWDSVVNVVECHIQNATGNRVLTAAREFFRGRGLPPYDPRKHTGLLRTLLVRTANDGRDVMACLVTAPGDAPGVDHLGDALAEAVPEVRSVQWYRNASPSGAGLGEFGALLRGENHITENLCGLKLKVSPESFLQTNTRQAEVLYGALLECIAEDRVKTAYDLYSGAGPIALLLARRAERVYALESNPSAVADARENAAANAADNVSFESGEVEKRLAELAQAERPDLVVVDPPRPGVHRKGLDALIDAEPRQVVYVSCNPATLARDAALLCESGYALRSVRPVDMFPHTYHIECVADFMKG